MQTLVFYFPYNGVGGVPVLFLRLINYLKVKYHIILVDNEKGYMARNKPPGVKVITPKSLPSIPEKSILITQTCPPWRIVNLDKVNKKVKLFFWHLFPDNLNPELISNRYWFPFKNLISRLRKKKLSTFIKIALNKKSLAVMDHSCQEKMNEKFNLKLKFPLLKICTNYPTYKPKNKLIDKKIINCCYFGRVEDYKTYAIRHLMDRLNLFNNLKIHFTIIGSGRDIEPVKKYAIDINFIHPIKFTGEIKSSDIDEYLIHQDIVFAMGTSILEAMKLGIPSFIMDYDFKDFDLKQKYTLMHKSNKLNFGSLITSKNAESKDSLNQSLKDIINNYNKISSESFKFWRDNFSAKNTHDDFIKILSEVELTIADIEKFGLTKPDFFSKVKFFLDKRLAYEGWKYV
jgi:hypothetical protein